MKEAVIVSAVRTAVGRAPRGSLRNTRPDDMAGWVVKEAMNRVPEGLKIRDAEMDQQQVLPKPDGGWATINLTPRETRAIAWSVRCE